MKVSEVKQEYQLQQWTGMVREQKESGLTIKQWCAERGVTEYAYYYRLRKIRQAACTALEGIQSPQLAELPLAPAAAVPSAQLRVCLSGGTVEITNADSEMVERVLRVLIHAE